MHVQLYIAILYNINLQHTGNSRAECPYSWGRGVPHSGGYPSLSETAASGCTHDKDKCCQEKLFLDIWIFILIGVWIYPFHTWISVPVGDEPADYSNDKDKCCKENYIWFLVKRFYFWTFVCHFERWIYFTIPAIVHSWDDIFNLCFAQMFVSDLI